jgi:Protein of unknown function (DUF2848)
MANVPVSGRDLTLRLETRSSIRNCAVIIRELVIAGWTGRDRGAVQRHIAELEALGVKRPSTTPMYYHVSAARLTTAPSFEVVGEHSSGEVEFVLLQWEGLLWVGIGSDHTDREVETYNVTVSKQMCEKPLAPVLWALNDVADHWERIFTRSWIEENGRETLYQEGPVSAMLPPHELAHGHFGTEGLSEGSVMFCGTHAAQGGIRPSRRFRFEMVDPALNRSISHAYTVRTLPLVT